MSAPLCILGGSGFVGARALAALASRGSANLRALEHRRPLAGNRFDLVRGDAADPGRLAAFLVPGATVLNFAYGGDDRAEALGSALAGACATRGVRRLVHVSSSSVYGRAAGRVIDESSPCVPVSAYERAKYRVEEVLADQARGKYELAILRPTAVFGPGGRNLESLALRVLRASRLKRYLRACAMGARRMHAVDVECVAAAVLFLAAMPLASPAERFLLSQDDEPDNQYQAIERFFAERFGVRPYPIAPLALPEAAVRVALRLAGRSNTDPQRRYSAAKLSAAGFVAPRRFSDALGEYASWIQRQAAG